MALNPLVSLFGRLVARSGRKRGNRQNDGQTDRQTDRQTYRPSTVTLGAHARRGLMRVKGTRMMYLIVHAMVVCTSAYVLNYKRLLPCSFINQGKLFTFVFHIHLTVSITQVASYHGIHGLCVYSLPHTRSAVNINLSLVA